MPTKVGGAIAKRSQWRRMLVGVGGAKRFRTAQETCRTRPLRPLYSAASLPSLLPTTTTPVIPRAFPLPFPAAAVRMCVAATLRQSFSAPREVSAWPDAGRRARVRHLPSSARPLAGRLGKRGDARRPFTDAGRTLTAPSRFPCGSEPSHGERGAGKRSPEEALRLSFA